jgi:RimJ/RimL family protein N-acetyltransferase
LKAFCPATIATERLLLVPLRPADADAMVEVLGDERLHEFIGGHPASHADLVRRYERLVEGSGNPDEIWLNWIVHGGVDQRPVGTVQATVTRHGSSWGATVAWVIGTPWQGRGFAAEAARALVGWLHGQGASVVSAHIHPAHRASEKVAERAGLTATAEYVDGERVWTTGLT